MHLYNIVITIVVTDYKKLASIPYLFHRSAKRKQARSGSSTRLGVFSVFLLSRPFIDVFVFMSTEYHNHQQRADEGENYERQRLTRSSLEFDVRN